MLWIVLWPDRISLSIEDNNTKALCYKSEIFIAIAQPTHFALRIVYPSGTNRAQETNFKFHNANQKYNIKNKNNFLICTKY